MKPGFTYIMANDHRMLYIGCTSNLEQRVWQHKVGLFGGYTEKYRCHRLVYIAEFADIRDAIDWERSWKVKSRAKKVALIEERNPRWNDLAWNWFGDIEKARREIAEARRAGDIC